MGKVAVWEFGETSSFDGERLFAEIEPSDTRDLRRGTLELTFVAERKQRATLFAHGMPGRDAGGFTLGLTQAGAVGLSCSDGTGAPFRLTTRDGFVAPGEVVQITILWTGAGGTFIAVNCSRCAFRPHDPHVGHIEPVPLRARMDLRGTHGFTVGAAAGGVAPFFSGRVQRVTLSDSVDAPTVAPPSAKILNFEKDGEPAVQPRRVSPEGARSARNPERTIARARARWMTVTTSEGVKPLTKLRRMDEVLTRDNGFQPVTWVGRVQLGWQDLARAPELQPIILKKDALGRGFPEADMTLTPWQRLLLIAPDAPDTPDEILLPARQLLEDALEPGVDALGVNYVHFHCASHELVQVNGVWVEAFNPGIAADWPDAEMRCDELFRLFPDLQTREKPLRS